MTAIQKMVKWLDKQRKEAISIRKLAKDPVDYDSFEIAALDIEKSVCESALKEAHRLAALEDKEKPSAPASLVESAWLGNVDLDKIEVGKHILEVFESLTATQPRGASISRYHPTSQTDVVLWEGLVKTGEPGLNLFKGHGEYESTVLFSVDYAKLKGQKGQLIFRKHGEAK